MSWIIQSSFGTKISPVILFIIVLLAVVFFIVALVHLFIRYLLKRQRSSPHSHNNYPEITSSRTFQRQLQQLFNLHDSGLDQTYIDSLPVFYYKDIMGLKEPFDCAVCLCEFSEDDKLRLLPLCSHAFHIDCIETWLLSNSTCPLCRGVILSFENPVFHLDDHTKENQDGILENCVLKPCEDDNTSAVISGKRVFSVRLGKLKSSNLGANLESEDDNISAVISGKRVFSVRLGKLKSSNLGANLESEVGESSDSNLGCRRCYSMGSFQYVVADKDLQVALCNNTSRECGDRGGGQIGNFTSDAAYGKKISKGSKGESFSVSKIWLWSKKGKLSSSEGTHYSSDLNVSLP